MVESIVSYTTKLLNNKSAFSNVLNKLKPKDLLGLRLVSHQFAEQVPQQFNEISFQCYNDEE